MASLSQGRRIPALVPDHEANALVLKGHGTLSNLIRTRSNASSSSPHWKHASDDEEEAIGSSSSPYLERSSFRHRNSFPPGSSGDDGEHERRPAADERRLAELLHEPRMRSMRLIGYPNTRYQWAKYWKTDEQLKSIKSKPVREYYERTNYLIQQYVYIDKLLDSSLPHDLLNEYNNMTASAFRRGVEVPQTISEEASTSPLDSHMHQASVANHHHNNYNKNAHASLDGSSSGSPAENVLAYGSVVKKVKRTPKDIYRPAETSPLIYSEVLDNSDSNDEEEDGDAKPEIPIFEDDDVDSGARIVTVAIYVNFAANAILLAGKIAVIITVPSVSVLASLVDAALDFLSTVIVWITTTLISRQDQYRYPVGRRRLEPVGVLVFSTIMITSFAQVAIEAISKLASGDHKVIQLTVPAIAIMLSTIVIKGLCWFWCRLIKNSSVQALVSMTKTESPTPARYSCDHD